jgi:uncharacterized protein
VAGYRAGDLERRYATLPIEEDVFINYGFVTHRLRALMHPRSATGVWTRAQRQRASAILEFVRSRGTVHPRDVDEHFTHGTVTNYWGGSSNATTHLLEAMQYRGLVRVVRRDTGIRVYGVQETVPPVADAAERDRRLDAMVDVLVGKYGPVPSFSLSVLVARLRYAAPQWRRQLKAALQRARHRLNRVRADGVDWYWPAEESMDVAPPATAVYLLAPFDPLVWDRRRFERLWGWAYRFEAYTPVKKRVRGYYALPLLWRDRVVGWGNLSLRNGDLTAEFGFIDARPRDRRFRSELDAEVDRMREFLEDSPSRTR